MTICLDVKALLRHVQRILAHDAEGHALRNLLYAAFVIELNPTAEPVLLAVSGVFEPGRRLVDIHVGTRGEHACFFVPEIVRRSRQTNDRHRVIDGDEVCLGDNL